MFCRALELARAGNAAVQRQVLKHLERVRNSSAEMASGIS